jgi:hypothetical protein
MAEDEPMTNTTPVIAGMHPDPSVCRAGDDYYLVCSSFEYFPGVPIFHSRDLRDWEQIGNVLTRSTQLDPAGIIASSGICAPTVRHHDGRFWMATTNVHRFMDGQLIVHADNPQGPWSDPVYVTGTFGIDPDLAWDDAGHCYLTYSGVAMGGSPGGIVQVLIDPQTGKMLGEPYEIWHGTGGAHPEGPHLYQVDGVWYLMIAEGGTERGHTVTIARGPAPQGPFEPCPHNPILTHRSTAHPVQNTGHADLVEAADGSWWAVHLGVRPRGYTPGFHVNGRETFLAAVTWQDGWPVIGELDPPVEPADHSFADDFSSPELHPRWICPGALPAAFFRGRALLCTRVRDQHWSARVTVDLSGGSARFVLRIDDRHWYGLLAGEDGITAVARVGDLEQNFGGVTPAEASVVLRIDAVDPPGAGMLGAAVGPDEIVLSVESDGAVRELGRLDGRYLSTEVAGGFTGRVLGIGGEARVLNFAYTTNFS